MHIAITGASSGIGAALARELGARGHSITLVARRLDWLERLSREIGEERTHVIAHDLADTKNATAWIEDAESRFGSIDVLINNAGVQIVAPTEEVDPDEGERLLAIDLLSPLRIQRAVLPSMIARKNGVIVNIASMASLAPTPGMTHYNAAKAGLAAASEALNGELRGTGVSVVTVYPGIIETTEMAKTAIEKFEHSALLARFPRGDERTLARHIERAIRKREARVIYPRSGALSRFFPTITRWLMDRVTPKLKRLAAA